MSSLPFIPEQHSVDSIFTTVSSSLSLIGCLFIVVMYLKFLKEKEFIVKLVFILAINDFIISIIFLVSTQLDIKHYNDIVNQHLPFICSVPDTLLHYFFISSFLWNVGIAFSLLQAAKYNNHLGVEKYYKYYHIISWGVPFVLISVLFILRIVKHADCLTYSELYPHLLFFIPLVGCFIYNIVVSVLVTRSLKRQGVSKRIMFDDSDSDDDDSVSSDDEGSSFSSSSVLLSWIPFLNKKSSSTQDIPSNISNHNRNNNNNRPNNNNNNNRTHSIPSKSSSSSTSTKNIIQPIPKNNKVIKKNNNNHKIIVSNSIEDIRYLDESTPKLVRTSIYYLMSFAICWIWPMIVVFFLTLETKNPLQFIFLTLSYIWVPLQGFLNALIYGLHDILWSRLKDRVRSHWGDITIISPSTLDPMQSKPLIDSFYEDEDGDEDKFIFKHQYDHSDFGDIESPTIDTTSIKYSIN